MLQSPNAFLLVEKGEPYSVGEALPLSKDKVLLGRTSPGEQFEIPLIPFHSPFVSRRHAMIEFKDESCFLTDLESRHGTGVNEEQLIPGEPWKLSDGDRISLARDEVVLVFSTAAPVGGETWDYPDPQLILDPDRREVILGGQHITLSGKLYDLLHVLCENRGRAVSILDIKTEVWQERGLGADGMPLVTNQEVYTLVRRLRKRFGPHRDLVQTSRGFGYMLDLK